MNGYILFGTDGCHLCEEAEALLEQAVVGDIAFAVADGAESLERYAVRIPVLYHPSSRRELGWPFDALQLRTFVND